MSAPIVIQQISPQMTPGEMAKFVLVNLIVDTKGMPQNVHVLRGVGMGLDEKAIQAVKQYSFKPAMKDGKPVPVQLNVVGSFRVF